jgi:hypothetical protein
MHTRASSKTDWINRKIFPVFTAILRFATETSLEAVKDCHDPELRAEIFAIAECWLRQEEAEERPSWRLLN